ncbi:hypothetical protein IWX50DRAFT_154272 [Phyllosticta citricarpa]
MHADRPDAMDAAARAREQCSEAFCCVARGAHKICRASWLSLCVQRENTNTQHHIKSCAAALTLFEKADACSLYPPVCRLYIPWQSTKTVNTLAEPTGLNTTPCSKKTVAWIKLVYANEPSPAYNRIFPQPVYTSHTLIISLCRQNVRRSKSAPPRPVRRGSRAGHALGLPLSDGVDCVCFQQTSEARTTAPPRPHRCDSRLARCP